MGNYFICFTFYYNFMPASNSEEYIKISGSDAFFRIFIKSQLCCLIITTENMHLT